MAVAIGKFIISPSTGVVLYTTMVLALIVCGLVSAAKGRWGWFLAGFLTFGGFWVVGAFQRARAGSVWSRTAKARRSR